MEGHKSALILGITGQDGSYLAEYLLKKEYCVHGLVRRSVAPSENGFLLERLATYAKQSGLVFELHHGDITDAETLSRVMRKVKPMEVYNLAAQSHVTRSFECPSLTAETNAVGVIHLLESIRNCGLKSSRVYQASSSEMFGNSGTASQNESTPLAPRSPYGVAKVGAHWTIANYREAYNMYAASGICFNHESPRRGRSFVSRRITLAIARIHHGEADCLYLANLDSQRDWGHARDYVEAMWLILQQPSPSDYVLASGRSYSIRQFVGKAFLCVGLKIRWAGSGMQEIGCDQHNRTLVRVQPSLAAGRPMDVHTLCGDATKARTQLGWQPSSSFEDLVEEMVAEDVKLVGDLVARGKAKALL